MTIGLQATEHRCSNQACCLPEDRQGSARTNTRNVDRRRPNCKPLVSAVV